MSWGEAHGQLEAVRWFLFHQQNLWIGTQAKLRTTLRGLMEKDKPSNNVSLASIFCSYHPTLDS